jgi:glycosyltransferase involved in cell wall biosynthesis
MVRDRKLRIMMLAPTPFFTDCGAHVRIYEEARALIRCGHSVRIVTYDSGRDMPDVQTERIAIPALLKKLPFESPWCRPYLDFLVMKQALICAKAFKPHLIHAHLHQGARIGARLKKKLDIPLLFDCQGSLSGELLDQGFVTAGSSLHTFVRRQEQLVNSGPADFIITSSTPLARDLVKQWGVPKNMIWPMIDGVNTSLFRPGQGTEVRVRLKLAPEVPLVVYLGALNRAQGIDTLLSAIVQLKSLGSPLRFLIMGSGDGEYRVKAAELGIERMIIFTGAIDYTKAAIYLAAGDIAVSAKLFQTESNSKLLNYMACGLPTVVFDTPVNRELLGDAGVYAEYGDCSDLAAKLTWLAGNAEERQRLSALGLTQVEQRHTWDNRGRALDEVYRVKLKR